MRRELDDTERTVQEVGARAARIEQARPALDVALQDVERLAGVQAQIKDALEQSQITHDEIGRLRESQSETRSRLAGIEAGMNEVKDRADEIQKLGPAMEAAQKKADRVQDSIAALDGRREFLEQIHRRVGDLASISARLDERGLQLQQRMDSAEQQFQGLTAQAGEVERMTGIVASVSSGLTDAAERSDAVMKAVAAIETRCGSVDEIAEKTRALGQEIEQRQHALEEAAKDLRRSSELRQKAATTAQKLDEQCQRLTAALTEADQRVEEIDTLSTQLEDRHGALQTVDKQLTDFEERMAKWSVVDQEIARSLEQIASRQSTIESLRVDLERMFTTAEKTAADVRAITTSQREIADTRVLLEEHRIRLREIKETAGSLDERQRQMSKAEERLARAEALLVDVRSSLETLQGQKALVDQAVEKAGSLRFMLKQAEAMIDGLREERKMTADVRSAITLVEEGGEELAAA